MPVGVSARPDRFWLGGDVLLPEPVPESTPPPSPSRNLVFAQIPLLDELRGVTDELSFCLRPSPGRGVGVYTTHGVKAGTLLALFATGPGGLAEHNRFVAHADLANHPPLLRAFATVYGVEDEDGFWIPLDFARMSIGSYLNHAEEPNAHHDADYNYHASRDLAPGEEILIDYRSL